MILNEMEPPFPLGLQVRGLRCGGGGEACLAPSPGVMNDRWHCCILDLGNCQDPVEHTVGTCPFMDEGGALTISHRCEFEHCVQRALEIWQLIWKGGESSH